MKTLKKFGSSRCEAGPAIKRFTCMLVVGLSFIVPASFAHAIASETDASDGTSATAYDSVSLTNDLLLGLTPTSVYTNTTADYTAGQGPVLGANGYVSGGLNDGVLGGAGGNNAGVTFFPGTGSNVAAAELPALPQFTFALDTSAATGSVTGYTLSTINTIYGYDQYGQSLANQDYTVSYSTVAAPTLFNPLATVVYDPFTNVGAPSSSSVILDTLGAVGVADIRFTFNEDANNSGTAQAGSVIRELIVNGAPTGVPEPSTYVMFALGAGVLGILARRRLV